MPLLGSLGNAAEIAYGPPSDYVIDPISFNTQTNLEPLDQGAPRVVYSNIVQITGNINVKSALGVNVFATEKVTTPEFILDPNYGNIAYAISGGFPSDVTALTYTSQPGTIKRDQFIVLRLTLEPSIPPTDSASFDKTDIFFNDYNPRFSQTLIPESASETGFNLTYNVKINIGQSDFDWLVQTRTLDSFPENFSFSGQEVNPPINRAGISTVVGS